MDTGQLIALNEQLAAWTALERPRAKGLVTSIGVESLPAVNQCVQRLAAEGLDVAAIIDQEKGSWPPAYFQLVDAGHRCGDLGAPLSRLVEFVSGVQQVRNRAAVAATYPLMVCGLALAVLSWICVRTIPSLDATARSLGVTEASWIHFMMQVRGWLPVWLPAASVLLVVAWCWFVVLRQGSGPLLSYGTASGWRANLRWAQVAELSSLLVHHQVEPERALAIAQRATLDDGRRRITPPAAWPPVLAWALAAGEGPAEKAARLHTAATIYRDLARWRTERLGRRLPIVLSVLVGGAATLLAGLSLMAPFAELMQNMPSLTP